MADANRALTRGEIDILRSVYGSAIRYDKVRIHSERWAVVFPKDRAMAPNGDAYFPGDEYADDFSSPHVTLQKKSIFVHEGAHLYQWYGLGWTVWARGPFDRDYSYVLVPGKSFQAYGLEAMGMIAQHYFLLRNGGRVAGIPYTLEDYTSILPVRA